MVTWSGRQLCSNIAGGRLLVAMSPGWTHAESDIAVGNVTNFHKAWLAESGLAELCKLGVDPHRRVLTGGTIRSNSADATLCFFRTCAPVVGVVNQWTSTNSTSASIFAKRFQQRIVEEAPISRSQAPTKSEPLVAEP